MGKTPDIWVLNDNQAGNLSQVLGVAEALNSPFEIKELNYTALASLPNFIRGRGFVGVDIGSKQSLVAPWPDLVIAAGRRTAPVARAIKHRSKGRTAICQIMYPGAAGIAEFDLICVPKHDARALAPNMIAISGAPHRVTPTRLVEAADQWSPTFASFPRPWLAVIVGGSTHKRKFTEAMAAELGSAVNQAASSVGGSLLVTTSRRTGDAQSAQLKSHLTVPTYLFDWGMQGANPYFGFLACADAIIVTGDSVSMCSEATAAAAPAFIYAPPGLCSPKHRRLHQDLYDNAYAKPFKSGSELSPWGRPKLNTAAEIAGEIKARFLST